METREAFVWQEQAACADLDSELFFAGDEASNRKAVDVCSGCPVKAQCLKANMDEPYGIFGGTTPGQRIDRGGGCRPSSVFKFDEVGRVVDEGRADPEVAQTRADRKNLLETRANSRKATLEAAAMYYQEDASLSVKTVARKFGMSHTTLGPYLHKIGAARSPHRKTATERMMKARGYGDETTLLIVKRLKSGEKPMEISRSMGVDKYKVYNLRNSIEKGVY